MKSTTLQRTACDEHGKPLKISIVGKRVRTLDDERFLMVLVAFSPLLKLKKQTDQKKHTLAIP